MLEEVAKLVRGGPEQQEEEVILKKRGDVFIMILNNRKANTFTHQFIRSINAKLD